uniref:Anthocyanidin 5,3-O-glucosyltransferase n=1 Tax=Aegilops tauschii TaxID=37682 RepID=M8CAG6_AEGTA
MPSVRFHTLPPVEDPPRLAPGPQFLASYLRLLLRYNDRLHDFLCSSTRVHAVVVDSVSVPADALEVTKRLGIPGYVMFTSGAATLAAFAQLPYVLGEGSRTSFRELGDAPVEFLGLPPVPASHLFAEVLEDPESDTERKINKLLMVGEMGLAAEMVGWQRGLVEAAEVERKVRLVMESEEGRELRARAAQHQEAAAAAWSDGGSSRAALALFLSDVARRWQARARGGEAA